MSKVFEGLCETSQTMIHAVMSRPMLRRLARARSFSHGFW
jgi:hypothetical protein